MDTNWTWTDVAPELRFGWIGRWLSPSFWAPRALHWRAMAHRPAQSSVSKPAFIDQLIEEAWAKAGVKPAKPATDEEFLRRAYLDLLGRIPNVQEARAFLYTREVDKRGKLVEYLLDHPDYAKNFATQWTVLLIGRQQPGPDGRPRGA